MVDQPRGTVAFLFTDIEGSTRTWQAHGAAMGAAVARHDELMRGAIAAHGGHVFKTIGDAFCAAFATASDALGAAIDAQRALAAEPWGLVESIRARMAIHVGAVEERDADYFGPAVNRVARLLSAGHGGQVLLSETAALLARERLPEGAGLLDLGAHWLKDLLEPERIRQLLHPDLPADFPAIRTLDQRPNNLPVQTTPLIGRERELTEVAELLRRDGVRLVTLLGPGGTGKTRLAVQVAADLIDDFPDGAWFVDLAPLSDPAFVAPAIASALGVREQGGQPVEETLADHLREKRLLLVLDNLEHLLPAAPAIGRLVAAAPGVRVLATSRAPLRLRGEREYPVAPLGLPRRKPPPLPEQLGQYAAVRLFIERAQAVRPDLVVTAANAPVIAEICHRLDGLPLAIELSAARVRLLSPEAMLARLEQRLPLLTGGARDLPERQQTLRAAIAWSHDLLTDDEQKLFRRLAAFAGGWTFEAAEAVCAPDGALDLFGGLERLAENSLVRASSEGGEPRFGMLETIREFAAERLEASGEADELRRRHASHFLALAEEADAGLTGMEQHAWLTRLEAEHDNLRRALAWSREAMPVEASRLAAALGLFWEIRGHLSEGSTWLRETLAAEGVPPAIRAKGLERAGMLAWKQGDFERAAALERDAFALAERTGAAFEAASALMDLGFVELNRGHTEPAADLLDDALARFRAIGDPWGTAMALNCRADVARVMNEHGRALAMYEEALAIFRRLGDRWSTAIALNNVGEAARRLGEPARAAAALAESIGLAHGTGDLYYVAAAFSNLAPIVATSELGAERAARLLGAADALLAELGAPLKLVDRLPYETAEATAKHALGDESYAAAWLAGRALALEDAAAEAIALADELAAECAHA